MTLSRRAGGVLFSKGFRPFFLGAAAFAALAVPLWLIALNGGFQPGGALGAMQWHAHEMLFGFSTAVIAGFLLTAVSNWTGRETAVGAPLLALNAIWLLGRIALFCAASLPRPLPLLIDLAFLPALIFACARPIILARNRRNYAIVLLLVVLWLANGWAHFGALHGDLSAVRGAHRAALDVISLLICIVTGRVVPMFTRNATQRPEIRTQPALEYATSASLSLLLLLDVSGFSEPTGSLVAALAGAFSLARMRRWGAAHAAREPLLWVLHLGALWLPIALLLRAAAGYWPPLPATSALHSLTAGAIGTLTLGMMARVSLGHTGRALHASPQVTLAFIFVLAAGVSRVVGPFLPSSAYLTALSISGALWSAAFLIFFAVYAKILCSPNVATSARR